MVQDYPGTITVRDVELKGSPIHADLFLMTSPIQTPILIHMNNHMNSLIPNPMMSLMRNLAVGRRRAGFLVESVEKSEVNRL